MFCSTVKRLLTNGYEVDVINQRWGLRPCQNETGVRGLRSGEIGPNPDAPPMEEGQPSMGFGAPSPN